MGQSGTREKKHSVGASEKDMSELHLARASNGFGRLGSKEGRGSLSH